MYLLEGHTMVDLSRKLIPGEMNNTFGYERELELKEIMFKMEGLADSWMNIVTLHDHIGTHLELPIHQFKDGLHLGNFPVDRCICGARLADVTFAGEETRLKRADIIRATDDDVRKGDAVLIYSKFEPEIRPILTLEVAEWLVEKGVNIVGIDSMAGIENDAHQKILGSGIPFLEELVNLDKVPAKRGTLISLPVSIEGCDSFPVRAVIVV